MLKLVHRQFKIYKEREREMGEGGRGGGGGGMIQNVTIETLPKC